jgi:hypothetical protein
MALNVCVRGCAGTWFCMVEASLCILPAARWWCAGGIETIDEVHLDNWGQQLFISNERIERRKTVLV